MVSLPCSKPPLVWNIVQTLRFNSQGPPAQAARLLHEPVFPFRLVYTLGQKTASISLLHSQEGYLLLEVQSPSHTPPLWRASALTSPSTRPSPSPGAQYFSSPLTGLKLCPDPMLGCFELLFNSWIKIYLFLSF